MIMMIFTHYDSKSNLVFSQLSLNTFCWIYINVFFFYFDGKVTEPFENDVWTTLVDSQLTKRAVFSVNYNVDFISKP